MEARMSNTGVPLVTFGTYNYEHLEILEDSCSQAMYLLRHFRLPQLIDTAMKYRNLPSILKVLEQHPDALIGWKVEHSSRASYNTKEARGSQVGDESKGKDDKLDEVKMSNDGVAFVKGQQGKTVLNTKKMRDGLKVLKSSVSPSRVFRILLHNYCGKKAYIEFQRLVEREFGTEMPIGICNVSAAQLEDLIMPTVIDGLDENEAQTARVDWVQNEYHPFLETRVPEICRQHGIRFEAHTVMTNLIGYAELFSQLGVQEADVSTDKAAELALRYAMKQGGVCFATTNYAHLTNNLKTLTNIEVKAEDVTLLSALSEFASLKRIVRYRGSATDINASWIHACDTEQIRKEILPKLLNDIATFEAGRIPSDLCIKIPKSYRPGGQVHGILAEMVFGEDLERQMNDLRAKLQRKQKNNVNSSADEADVPETGIIIDEDLRTRLDAKWSCTLDVLLTKMRNSITKARADKKTKSKKAPEPVQAVEQPDALPMDDYPEAEEFDDFIQFLEDGGKIDADINVNGDKELPSNIRFKHGTINSDGRLDMCKQGFRNAFIKTCDAVIKDGGDVPVNIRFKYGTLNSDGRLDMCKQGFRNAFIKTCDAVVRDVQGQGVEKKPLIKHYLIGNNRIGEDGGIPGEGDRRVAALARMIKSRPDIITWFLAGNCMDHLQIRHVTEALEHTQAKYVWFKMNPIKTGSYHFGKMLVKTPSIELLDLFNCGVCNDGVAAFTRGLADGAAQQPSSPHSNLRHLYLSINAISSAEDIESMLSYLPSLESLFIGVNPLGDKGLALIAQAIIDKAPCRGVLRRLNIDSLALTDASLPLIEDIVKACPNLVSLELGSYKSTNYFDQKHNRFDVKNASTRAGLERIARALVHNTEMLADKIKGSLPMHYLGLQHALVVKVCPDSPTSVQEAKRMIDEFIEDQLHRGTGINVNGIINLYPSEDGSSYSHTGEWGSNNVPLEETKTCGGVGSDKPVITTVVCGGMFYVKGVNNENLRVHVKHPWPAVDHIKSIYRNTMKK